MQSCVYPTKKAIKEAKLVGETLTVAKSAEGTMQNIPDTAHISLPENAAYLHITSNETIAGTQYQQFPESGQVPLFADMSSDILSRKIDASQFALIYAGAQKNLGPSGVTVVVLRGDLVDASPKHLPTMMRYDTYIANDSLYNTPPVYSVYIMNLVLKWIKENGGISAMEDLNRKKTKLIYDAIDQSGGFYQGIAAAKDRSIMNITFGMNSEELEKQFLQEAAANGFIGLKGHRSVGHLRASTYNAVTYESCKALADLMKDFQQKHA